MSEATQAGERLASAAKRLGELPGWSGVQNTMTVDGFDYDWLLEFRDFTAGVTDPTKIDEAFIQSIGWDRLDSRDIYTTYVSARSMSAGPVVHISWEVNGGCDGWYVSGENIPPIETRGQLRMLCASLGIPLPPPAE